MAYLAEEFVAASLIGSKHVNQWFDVHLPYDIDWNGILIDVKATKKLIDNSSGEFCMFSAPTHNQHDIMFVYMYVDYEPLFWVAHQSKVQKRYFIEDAVTFFDLPKIIENKYKKYSSVYKKTVDKQLSML